MISVVELTTFKKATKKLLSNESVEDLKLFLSDNPTAGIVIKGTGGLRKLRWSLDNNKGKSGGSRVIYYFQNEIKPLYLIDCYAKNEKENLSDKERNELMNITKLLK